jgi:hypothetical protein
VKNYLNVDIIVNKIAMVKKIAKFVIKNAWYIVNIVNVKKIVQR